MFQHTATNNKVLQLRKAEKRGSIIYLFLNNAFFWMAFTSEHFSGRQMPFTRYTMYQIIMHMAFLFAFPKQSVWLRNFFYPTIILQCGCSVNTKYVFPNNYADRFSCLLQDVALFPVFHLQKDLSSSPYWKRTGTCLTMRNSLFK